MIDVATAYVVGVIFLATLIRSTFGFGEALVAVPLLALYVPVTISVPLAVLMSVTVAAVVVAQDWRKIHLRSAGWMVAATLAGIPLGLILLKVVEANYIRLALGLLIVLFSLYCIFGRGLMVLKRDSRTGLLLSGFFAGILGGAFGLNGPPLVIYGAMRRWSAQHFRATLQAYFFPASLMGLIGYQFTGLMTRQVMVYYVLSLLPAFIAILLGRWLNHRIRGDAFITYVYIGLCGIGALLLFQGIHHG